MIPSRDPELPHGGRVFQQGQWRTPEQAQRKIAKQREWYGERMKDSAYMLAENQRKTLGHARRHLDRLVEKASIEE